jgi:hypothetical protein
MPGPNLLIGSGETLTSEIVRESGGGNTKAYPYTIEQARQRLAPQIHATLKALRALPAQAKPRGEGVSLLTVHPTFLSKWRLPDKIFEAAGLRGLGSKGTMVVPDSDVRLDVNRAEPKLAAHLYLAGKAQAWERLLDLLMSPKTKKGLQDELRRIERIRLQEASDRLTPMPVSDEVAIELLLHSGAEDAELLKALEEYARANATRLQFDKRLAVPGLLFIPGVALANRLNQLALFAHIRAIRPLPSLRLNRPITRTRLPVPVPALPTEAAFNESTKVVVFDGGLGTADLARWATEEVHEPLATSHADYLAHGTEVTSTLLFGAVEQAATELPRPYFAVEHHRVVGATDESDPDLYDCMHRIDAVLSRGDVQFCNLSLGPHMFIDDDQPHAWTCMLDAHLSLGTCLATVAVGNDGELGNEVGRIQPPSDAVNALAVGAASSDQFMWDRAAYSCVGPGRSPGFVKPDGLSFGGTEGRPLVVMSPFAQGLCAVTGTSYAAPMALRVAAGAAASSETKLSATALRALMIHRSEVNAGHDPTQVGWGRFPQSVDELLTCADNEATVLYQGHIAAGVPIRARLPIPSVGMGTNLAIKATFCFASPVDPADSLNYTRHGLTIVFRPRGADSSEPFFSASAHSSEDELRRDAHKWETVLHRARSWRAEELLDACFDIHHGARDRGKKVDNKLIPPLPYVLVVTIHSDAKQPVYSNVLTLYRTLQPIQLRTRVRAAG